MVRLQLCWRNLSGQYPWPNLINGVHQQLTYIKKLSNVCKLFADDILNEKCDRHDKESSTKWNDQATELEWCVEISFVSKCCMLHASKTK